LRDLLDGWAARQPDAPALSDDRCVLTWQQLHARVHAVAAALQAEGLQRQEAVALLGRSDAAQLVAYLAVVVAGGVAVPLPTSATRAQWEGMLANCRARWVFADSELGLEALAGSLARVEITADRSYRRAGGAWGGSPGTAQPVAARADDAFNIIYSSGTTGQPKGIVQSQGMRWMHMRRSSRYHLGPASRMLVATPLYSNTTLVAVLPALASGSQVHLMPKFSVEGYLAQAQAMRATHTMLVPVQYQRLMAHAGFDRYDLSAFVMKMCTSAPFAADLKADILRRWPGGLLEIYGMTEGGGTFLLDCHLHPHKLHTVGQPTPGHQICLLDEQGQPLAPTAGVIGEVAGHSMSMMTAYFNDLARTADAQWFDAQGRRYIRTGDLGSFDEDGFLLLRGRRKDMIISGGFNIYPIDLETVMCTHPQVAECAVIGVPSPEWGETPVAYVVPAAGAAPEPQVLKDWFAGQVGRTQRLSAVLFTEELPRNAIGKVDKNQLRALYAQSHGAPG
jgi:acyl-CoA synthetase (AMP-forming)/AMP-acid ligase II